MATREDLLELTDKLLAHVDAGTTDQAATTLRVPTFKYHEQSHWDAEMALLFKRVPLPLALSCEMREPNSYKAMDACGTPVLITRAGDGVARAFLNVCRHRGMIVAADGCGSARRFACPYHAWVYDGLGALVGVYGDGTFGDFDRTDHGLVALPCDERAGVIFVTLTPAVDLPFGPRNIDDWLGSFGDVLSGLDLAEWHVYDRRVLPSPAWKAAFDGYVESYHFASLHTKSLYPTVMSNTMTYEPHGPHLRLGFPRQGITDLHAIARENWDPEDRIADVHIIFPMLSLAGGWKGQAMVSQLFPGPTPDRSRTVQTFISRDPLATDSEKIAGAQRADFLHNVVRDEDYATGFRITSALRSGANKEFIFGRNEVALQHVHRWVDTILTTEGKS